MAQKQQALMNALNKLTRQYFLYQEDNCMDPFKVRMRTDLHRVEQVLPTYSLDRVMRRLGNDRIGLMHPHHKPYVPVAGWPVLNLEELVLNTMASQLDPKVWQVLRIQFERMEIKRATDKRTYKDILSDYTVVHRHPTSGYYKIKAHLAESEARIHNVKAGFDFKQHFQRSNQERLKKETRPKETVKQFSADPDLVLAMERQRRDMILFLEMLKDFLEKLLLLRVRHLKSHTPINLSALGTDKDHVLHHSRSPMSPNAAGIAAGTSFGRSPPTPCLPQGRAPHLQFPGAPPMQHSFKDQIIAERPPFWPVKVSEQWGGRIPGHRDDSSATYGSFASHPDSFVASHTKRAMGSTCATIGGASSNAGRSDCVAAGRDVVKRHTGSSGCTTSGCLTHAAARHESTAARDYNKRPTDFLDPTLTAPKDKRCNTTVSGRTSIQTNTSDSPSVGSENLSREDNLSVTGINSLRQRGMTNREIMERFRKLWPPAWISMASLEQGYYIVDPACPTKEYNQCLGPTSLRRRKSLSNILETRDEWARMRSRVSRNVDENLWREDREKLESFRVEYATLSTMPLSKPYPTHQRQVEELLRAARRQRQKTEIYDCELSQWYKFLVDQVYDEVGKNDEEINTHLESIKVFFKMSATFPKLGKAKLALITMSLPAYVVCKVHVQRALTFILTEVLQAPGLLLTGWLASRGLPLVLIKTPDRI